MTVSIIEFEVNAAVSTAVHAPVRVTIRSSTSPAYLSAARAVAAARTTSSAQPTAATTRRNVGPPTMSETLTSAITAGGRSSQ